MTTSSTQIHKVLTDVEIKCFIDRGYVVLRDAFPKDAAAAVAEWLWPRLCVSENDPSTWTKWLIRINDELKGPLADACMTERYFGALDDLLGEGAWNKPLQLGGWPVLFPGFASGPWIPPVGGWHVDGNWFQHHIDSADQGLLPVFLFSDIGQGDGGTAIRPGSHKVIARILAASEPEGLDMYKLAELSNQQTYDDAIECAGDAGDIVLMHPFMSHATSTNHGSKVRIICNPPVSLKQQMNLHRDRIEDYSPVEQSIVEAICALRA